MQSIKDLAEECKRTHHCVLHKKRKMKRYSDTDEYDDRDPLARMLGE